MSRNGHTRSKSYDRAAAQLHPHAPEDVVEMLARQLDRADDARDRIVKEGSVVRDMKGSVIPHPSINIELKAGEQILKILDKWKRPVMRRR